MEPDREVALMEAKFGEAAAWGDEFACDGLDDYDDAPLRTLTCYRVDYADTDQFPLVIGVDFLERDGAWLPVYAVHHDGLAHEVESRDAAIAKYDELLPVVASVTT